MTTALAGDELRHEIERAVSTRTAGLGRIGKVGDEKNEFCLFLKPELTELSPENFVKVWAEISEILDRFSVNVVAWTALPGSVLAETGAIQAHYGVIDKIARHGRTALSAEAESNLRTLLDDKWSTATSTTGAFQFLEKYPFFSTTALAILFDNVGSVRLAGGSYAAPVNVRGENQIVFNGFHPDQLQRFTNDSASILVLWCASETSWVDLRKHMTGATNPENSEPGSLRGTLLRRQDEFGIPEFNTGMNGIHVSAGPIEGIIELVRYFGASDNATYADTKLGRAILEEGLGEATLRQFEDNVTIDVDGTPTPIFDATEELDTDQALEFLRTVLKPNER
ncbi:hypothetical protein IFM12275_41210 [Nocardia sputorum]|uniref:hypothetical protein n=1 Tax=Nocardia TaxID=1817 RepID=UPI0024577FBF|nr:MULTISPECIES: hypothetical protein [Nocardia]BDT94145.1 hypothetical protein IFM12275_41210 [Nocardia sputorum]